MIGSHFPYTVGTKKYLKKIRFSILLSLSLTEERKREKDEPRNHTLRSWGSTRTSMKPTTAVLSKAKRWPMTSKQGNKDYYKGTKGTFKRITTSNVFMLSIRHATGFRSWTSHWCSWRVFRKVEGLISTKRWKSSIFCRSASIRAHKLSGMSILLTFVHLSRSHAL